MTRSTALPAHADVVVAGSGAAGLVAAIAAAVEGADVLLVEDAAELGGTTALGGGRVWIPANGDPANDGDSVENAVAYLEQIFDTGYRDHIETFAREVAPMSRFVERHSPHRFVVCPNYPDYHPEFKGATVGGRCFDMVPLDLSSLVPEAAATRMPPGYVALTHAEWERWRYPSEMDQDLLASRLADGIRTGGVALAAALIDGAVRSGVRIITGTRLAGLVTAADGSVSGAVVGEDGDTATVTTSQVVLATGGYDQSPQLRGRLLPEALGTSASAPTNTGTTWRIARELGAAVDNAGEGWWMPMVRVPGDTVDGQCFPRALIRERGAPRQILVNRAGQRFVDEAVPYNEFGKAMHRDDGEGNFPNREAFLVFDRGFRDRYPLPGLPPEGPLPEHVTGAATLEDLATAIGVDAGGLAATVERWNAMCAGGEDKDHGRGGNAYDRYYGDPAQPEHPNLGPIDRSPYYAVELVSGTIGSKGGPVTDLEGRVRRPDGSTITGLYAAGNAAAFWTGDGYPGPGATLAVGMTFGRLAGRAAGLAAGRRSGRSRGADR